MWNGGKTISQSARDLDGQQLIPFSNIYAQRTLKINFPVLFTPLVVSPTSRLSTLTDNISPYYLRSGVCRLNNWLEPVCALQSAKTVHPSHTSIALLTTLLTDAEAQDVAVAAWRQGCAWLMRRNCRQHLCHRQHTAPAVLLTRTRQRVHQHTLYPTEKHKQVTDIIHPPKH